MYKTFIAVLFLIAKNQVWSRNAQENREIICGVMEYNSVIKEKRIIDKSSNGENYRHVEGS